MKEVSFIQTLLDAGFLFILRMAIDDSSKTMIKAAINCLKSLVCRNDIQVRFILKKIFE